MQYLLNFFFSAMAILRTFFLNQPHSHKYISPRLSKSILWGRNFETKTFFRNLEYFKTHLYQFHVTSLFSQVPPENTRNRTSCRRYSTKKVLLKISQYSKGEHLCWSLFLIKLQAYRTATLLKRYFVTGVFYEYCKVFKKIYFENILERLFLQKTSGLKIRSI